MDILEGGVLYTEGEEVPRSQGSERLTTAGKTEKKTRRIWGFEEMRGRTRKENDGPGEGKYIYGNDPRGKGEYVFR